MQLLPSAQSSTRNENCSNKNLVKNRNWIFLVVHYFASKLEFVSNLLWMIVDYVEYAKLSGAVDVLCFWWEIPFLGKYGQKIKVVCFSWNLIARLIWICRNQWQYSFFRFQRENTVCSYHVTYAFQSESTFYSCLNTKEPLAWIRREIWSLSDWLQLRSNLQSLSS